MADDALMHVTAPLHRSRPDEADRVFAESEGRIDGDQALVQVTHRGLFLCVSRNGEDLCFGIDLSELARTAADQIERHFKTRRTGI